MKLFIAAVVLATAACTVMPGAEAQSGRVTDRINRSVTLAPGADVEVRGINGRVTVETVSGVRTAEIRVQIEASSREALERRPILIESTANSLTIRTENNRGNSDREWVRHEVVVRIPREVNLDIGGVNGRVDVGDIDGEVELSGINGATSVRHAGTVTDISAINGRTSIAIGRLADRGLSVTSINGGIELRLPPGVNATINANAVNGGIDSDMPMTVTGRLGNGRLNARLGDGGPTIAIRAVNGGVRLTETPRPD